MTDIQQRIARLGIAVPPPDAMAAAGNVVLIMNVQRYSAVERVWLATMAALATRRDGARGEMGDADEVVKVLDRLYRQRRIDLAHARVLRVYGERGARPNANKPAEAGDARLWREATEALTFPLRSKGLVP